MPTTVRLVAAMAMAILAPTPAMAEGTRRPPAGPPAELRRDGRRDFDFLIGRWKIHNRRLEAPLTGSARWYEFEAESVVRPVLDGGGNLDEYVGDSPKGRIHGLTLRLYRPASAQWHLHWASGKDGVLSVPTVGGFRGGRGEFFDHEEIGGRMVLVRYVWSDVTADRCRWEQAFSLDGGRTWETNWIMRLERVR